MIIRWSEPPMQRAVVLRDLVQLKTDCCDASTVWWTQTNPNQMPISPPNPDDDDDHKLIWRAVWLTRQFRLYFLPLILDFCCCVWPSSSLPEIKYLDHYFVKIFQFVRLISFTPRPNIQAGRQCSAVVEDTTRCTQPSIYSIESNLMI